MENNSVNIVVKYHYKVTQIKLAGEEAEEYEIAVDKVDNNGVVVLTTLTLRLRKNALDCPNGVSIPFQIVEIDTYGVNINEVKVSLEILSKAISKFTDESLVYWAYKMLSPNEQSFYIERGFVVKDNIAYIPNCQYCKTGE